eukprot:CAMPEP_0181105716 /NCGR_PEP_ID=MMETSP1071-20121207/16139_1 /TAXON_ID=35127 /ORGANISM="Thalassiosira sp., Strain NH16" /LENGTH=187 /DNA_ID=CAMNT_0023189059 /DNA_START=79 /DNA_END=639 /DNA_ORIENTATION=+
MACPSRTSVRRTMATSNNDDSPSLNMADLRDRMDRQGNQYAKLLMEQSEYAEGGRTVPESVHIVLFHPGTPKQHVHTVEFPKNSGNNLILAFESGGDCAVFARMLQELEFVDPCPEETVFEPFAQYCEMSGLSLMIVPNGFELTPPQINANDDDEDSDEGSLADDDDISIVTDVGMKNNDEDALDSW